MQLLVTPLDDDAQARLSRDIALPLRGFNFAAQSLGSVEGLLMQLGMM
jgi:hypothetical protein